MWQFDSIYRKTDILFQYLYIGDYVYSYSLYSANLFLLKYMRQWWSEMHKMKVKCINNERIEVYSR